MGNITLSLKSNISSVSPAQRPGYVYSSVAVTILLSTCICRIAAVCHFYKL